MLSGRYPSDEFAELRPRITWDRIDGHCSRPARARSASRSSTPARSPTAGCTASSSPGAAKGTARVGELDEEMVFESRVGETFVLGASSWRIEEITHDRVLVSPRPASRARCRSGRATARRGRSSSGRRSAARARAPRGLPPAAAVERLVAEHDLDRRAAENLLAVPRRPGRGHAGACPTTAPSWSSDTATSSATGASASSRRSAAASSRPWALAVVARVREETGARRRVLWTDDGFVVRFPDSDTPPDTALLPAARPTRSRRWSSGSSGASALFAARFREVAGRALLLPRRRAGARAPLVAAAQARGRPARGRVALRLVPDVLETYRECLRDVFDLPALVDMLRQVGTRAHPRASRSTRRCRRRSPPRCSSATSPTSSTTATPRWPSAARRRSRSITRSCASCSARPSCASCSIPTRDRRARAAAAAPRRALPRAERRRRARPAAPARRSVGGGDRGAIAASDDVAAVLRALERARRDRAGAARGRAAVRRRRGRRALRDALGAPLPAGFPRRSCSRCATRSAISSLRYARTHGPFTTDECARRVRARPARWPTTCSRGSRRRARARGRVPAGRHAPRVVRRRACCARCASARSRGCGGKSSRSRPPRSGGSRRRGRACRGRAPGLDALLDAIEQLQGAPLPASVLETEVLPARVEGYRPADLDLADGARARSCGWASSRSASATAASRCTSPITCARLPPPSTPPERTGLAARSSST